MVPLQLRLFFSCSFDVLLAYSQTPPVQPGTKNKLKVMKQLKTIQEKKKRKYDFFFKLDCKSWVMNLLYWSINKHFLMQR